MQQVIPSSTGIFRESLLPFIPCAKFKPGFLTEAGCEVIGKVENSAKALELIEQLKPDAILLDLNMPKMNGIEVINALKKQSSANNCFNNLQ